MRGILVEKHRFELSSIKKKRKIVKIEKQIEIETEIETDRQIDRPTDRQRERERERKKQMPVSKRDR